MKNTILCVISIFVANVAAADDAKSIDEAEAETAKLLKAGYDDAKTALDSKGDAAAVQRGQKAAENCLRMLSVLDSVRVGHGRGTPAYDPATTTVTTSDGVMTLAATQTKCKSMLTELQQKKIDGCGTKRLSVFQHYLGGGKWGQMSYGISETFDPVACAEMPKRDKFAGKASIHRARFKRLCGNGVVVADGDWGAAMSTSGDKTRAMSGTCYARGKLQFKTHSMY